MAQHERSNINAKVGDVWMTRGGTDVYVTAVDKTQAKPYTVKDGNTAVYSVHINGQRYSDMLTPRDLITYGGAIASYSDWLESNEPDLEPMPVHDAPTLDAQHTPVDMVNRPPHYTMPGLQIEWMDVKDSLLLTVPDGTPYSAANKWIEALSYMARSWRKNGVEDLCKARVYIDLLIKQLEDHS